MSEPIKSVTPVQAGPPAAPNGGSNTAVNEAPEATNKEKQEILKIRGEMKKFTGNTLISWDSSVTKVKDQRLIQEHGAYFVNSRADLPEVIRTNMAKTAHKIRERGGIILPEDIEDLTKTDVPLKPKVSIGIISIFTEPTLLFYGTRKGSKGKSQPMKWRLLKYQNKDATCLETTDLKMKDVLKSIGRTFEGKIQHSLIGFSIHSGTGVKFRNGFVYDVSPPLEGALLTNSTQTNILRSISPRPKSASPTIDKETPPILNPPTPRFQRTPLKFTQSMKESEDINDIKIKNLSSVTTLSEFSATSEIIKSVQEPDKDEGWKEQNIELEKGIILHIKYKIERMNNQNNIPVKTIQIKSPKRKDIEKPKEKLTTLKRSTSCPPTKTPQQKQKPKQKPVINKQNDTQEEQDKPISSNIQIYKNQKQTPMYNPLTQRKQSYKIEGIPPRRVSKYLLKHFSDTFTIRRPVNAQFAMLNLPSVALDSTLQENPASNEYTTTIEKKAQTKFINGKYSDAFTIITGNTTKPTNPKYEEVAKLFPQENNEKEIQNILNSIPKPKGNLKIFEKQVAENMSSLKNGKGCGPSGMSAELLRQLWKHNEAVRTKITELVNLFINKPTEIDDNFFLSNLHCIPKQPTGIRPIAVEELFTKLVNKIVCQQLMAQTYSKIHQNQYCIREMDSQMEAVNNVKQNIKEGYTKVIAVDFKNAYGMIHREHIIKQLKDMEVNPTLIKYIHHLLEKQQMMFVDNEGKLRTINPTRGIAQGDPTSSLLFCIGVNNLLELFNKPGLRTVAYADDFILMAKKESVLLEEWKSFMEKANSIGLEINTSKTKLLYNKKNEKETNNDSGLKLQFYNEELVWTYLDIPISENKDIIIEHLKTKLEEFKDEAKTLWNAKLPIQTKYHLYQSCLVGKLSYYFKGIYCNSDLTPKELQCITETDDEIRKFYPKIIEDIPSTLRSLPYIYGGLNMTTLDDLSIIIHITSKLKRNQRPIGYEYIDIPPNTHETYKIRQAYFMAKLFKEPTLRNRIYNTEHLTKLTLSFQKPPTSSKQFLNNSEFTMLIDQVFKMDHTDVRWKGYDKCPQHTDKNCDLSHVTNCVRCGCLQNVRCHNEITYYILRILKKNPKFRPVNIEDYSDFQQELRNNNKTAKRADITYYIDKIQHSLDIAVVSSSPTNNAKFDPLGRHYTEKLRNYQKEPNVHPIIFGGNGDIYDKSWEVLTQLGLTIFDLRNIQHIIVKHQTQKINDAMTLNVDIWKQRDRNSRRRNNKQKNQNNNQNSHITDYLQE